MAGLTQVLRGHKHSVETLVFSAAEPLLVSGSEDCTIRVWDLRTNRTVKCIRNLPSPAAELQLTSNDASSGIALLEEAGLVVWDLRGQQLPVLDSGATTTPYQSGAAPAEVSTFAIGSERGAVACVLDDGAVQVGVSGRWHEPLQGVHNNIGCGVSWCSAAEFVTASFDGTVARLQVDTTAAIAKPKVVGVVEVSSWRSSVEGTVSNPPIPNCLDVVGPYAALGKGNGNYAIVDISEMEMVLEAPAHAFNAIATVKWLVEGSSLLTVPVSGELTVWDVGDWLAPVEGSGEPEATEEGPPPSFATCLRDCMGNVTANDAAVSSVGQVAVGVTSGDIALFDMH